MERKQNAAMKTASIAGVFLLTTIAGWWGVPAQAQPLDPVSWTLSSGLDSAPPGTTVPLRFTATIDPGWHVYSLTVPPGGLVNATRVSIEDNPDIAGYDIYQPEPERKLDETIGLNTELYENQLELWIPVTLADDASGDVSIVASAWYQSCDNRQCLIPKTKIGAVTIHVDPAAPVPAAFVIPSGYQDVMNSEVLARSAELAQSAEAGGEAGAASTSQSSGTVPVNTTEDNMGAFILTAFGFGLAAIFTPCVFPMIPITVSFFLNQRGGVLQAVVFAAGIVALFCALGLGMTALMGPFGVVAMSSSPWVNGFIAAVFFFFSLSLLGAFEINLPSSLVNKMDRASRRGGYLGTLLMGLTFSLTSFACVGPFVGPLLVSSVQGDPTQPVIGMASFATGLASPFFFLAAFPSYLPKLPKSGGWMSRVKVVMGFVLLAVMFKYLSNIDQVLQLGFLTRERFLAAWFVLFAMAGLYLLGLLKLEGVDGSEELGIGRLLVAALLLIFSFSLLPGMFGGALGELDAYVPVASSGGVFGSPSDEGPVWMKDQYEEALEIARTENKLVLVNFTGYTCTNCHWMKANMFPRPAVEAALSNFVLVDLYIDGGDASSERYQQMEQDRFNLVSMPFYVLMDANETVIDTFGGSTRDEAEFLEFLETRSPLTAEAKPAEIAVAGLAGGTFPSDIQTGPWTRALTY